MQIKNKDVKFNFEKDINFYIERLVNCIAKKENLIGKQIKNYTNNSILYNPVDMDYTKEELEEKLMKTKTVEQILLLKLKEKN